MIVKLLTPEQKISLIGNLFKEGSVFSFLLDVNNNWVITKEIAESTTNPDFLWVKDLPEIDYEISPSKEIELIKSINQ